MGLGRACMTDVDVAATPPPVPAGFAPSPSPSPPPPPPPAARFIGNQRAYWRLLIRGSALLAVTLGIYRFWFATDVRRFLWSETEISGETLEYSGTANELLIGFLIAIAVLVPLNLVLFVTALGLGPVGRFASSLSFPILFFLGQFAIYRARRYRLTRTIYRGVRCHQDGSALRYAVCGCFWWIMIVLTLGLAYPFAQSRLERFKMRHTYYGNLQGRFEGSGWQLFLRGLLMWLAVVGPIAFAVIFGAITVDWDAVTAASRAAADGAAFLKALGPIPTASRALGIVIIALVLSLVLAAVLYPVFQAVVLRWWIGGLRLSALGVRSRLRTGTIYKSYLRFLGYGLLFSIATAIAVGVVLGGINAALAAVHQSQLAGVVSAAAGIVSYVAVMLGYSAIYQGTVKLTTWRHAWETITLDNVALLDGVTAEGAPSSAVGEGLADALNVGSF
jgi:uncharacterized membrane protein YjgN (DUF898 family)